VAAAPAADPARTRTVRAVLIEVLDGMLRLLHPFMPFLTEELWQRLPGHGASIVVAPYPAGDLSRRDALAEGEISAMTALIGTVRNLRAESGIDPARRIRLLVHPNTPQDADLLGRHRAALAALARCESVEIEADLLSHGPAARGVTERFEAAIPLEGILDLAAESARLKKEREKLEKDLAARTRKLSDESFLSRAPEAVVAKEKTIHLELSEKLTRIDRILATLGG
jgi:valyl-tRNA synthetase